LLLPSYLITKMKIDNKANIRFLISYIGAFFLLWTLYAFYISPPLKLQHSALYTFDIFKLLIWVAPVFIYLKYKRIDALVYLKLKAPTKNAIKWTILISFIFIIYQIIGTLVVSQQIRFNPFFELHYWIKGVLLVGITEEIAFRGFFLQEIAKHIDFKLANILTAILFLLIHFPGFFATHHFPPGVFLKICTFSFIFIFGIIEGYVLKKSESLWACIVIHSITDFMANSLGDLT